MNCLEENFNRSSLNHDSKNNFLQAKEDNVLVMLENRKESENNKSQNKANEGMIIEESVMINNFTGEEKKLKVDNMILDVEEEFLVKEDDYGTNLNLKDEKVILNLKEEIETLHPRRNIDGQLSLYPICSTSTGCIGCCSSFSKSDLEPEGQGLVFYFKLLKSMFLIFFIISGIYSPLYYIYIQNNTDKEIENYRDALFLTTLGNMGSTLYNCQKFPVSAINNQSTYTFSLDCKDMNISYVTNFGLSGGLDNDISNQQSCQNFSSYIDLQIDSTCSFLDYFNNCTIQNCAGKTKCEFDIELSEIKNGCKLNNKSAYYYMSYTCYSKGNLCNFLEPEILIGNLKIQRNTFSFIVVGADIISMTILFVGIIILTVSKHNTETYFKNNVIEISDYTLNFENLNFDGLLIYQEINDLIVHLNQVYTELEKTNRNEENYKITDCTLIYDINYPLINDGKFKLYQEKIKISQEIRNLKKIVEAISEKEIDRRKRIDTHIEKLYIFRKQLDGQLINIQLKSIDDIYVTFCNQKIAATIFNAYSSRGACSRIFKLICCKYKEIKFFYFRNNWLKVSKADQPSNIIWINIPYSSCKRIILKLISLIVSLILVTIIFSEVVGEKAEQTKLNDQYNTDLNCNYVEINSNQEVIDEFLDNQIEMKSKVKLYCYCYNKIISIGIPNTINLQLQENNGKTIEPCQWVTEWATVEGLKIGTIVLVALVNILLSVIIHCK